MEEENIEMPQVEETPQYETTPPIVTESGLEDRPEEVTSMDSLIKDIREETPLFRDSGSGSIENRANNYVDPSEYGMGGQDTRIKTTVWDVDPDEYWATLSTGKQVARYQEYIPGIDNRERLAQMQTRSEKWGNSIKKFGQGVGASIVGGTAGLVTGTLQSIIEGNATAIHSNYFTDWAYELNERNDYKLPVYTTQEYDNKSLFKQMGHANFWAEDVLGGSTFTVGMLATEALWAGATGGASLISAAPRVAARMTARIGAKGAAKRVGAEAVKKSTKKLINTATVKQAQKSAMESTVRAGKMKGLVNTGRQIYTSAFYEAATEAKFFVEETREDYISEFEMRNGRRPTMAEMTDFESDLMSSANWVTASNIALVGGTNIWTFGKFLTGTKATGQFKNNVLKRTLFGQGLNKNAKGLVTSLKPTKLQKIAGRVYGISQPVISEGFVEEGGQNVIGTSASEYILSAYNPDLTRESMDMTDALYAGMAEAYGTKEGAREILVGGIVGLLFGGAQSKFKFDGVSKGVEAMNLEASKTVNSTYDHVNQGTIFSNKSKHSANMANEAAKNGDKVGVEVASDLSMVTKMERDYMFGGVEQGAADYRAYLHTKEVLAEIQEELGVDRATALEIAETAAEQYLEMAEEYSLRRDFAEATFGNRDFVEFENAKIQRETIVAATAAFLTIGENADIRATNTIEQIKGKIVASLGTTEAIRSMDTMEALRKVDRNAYQRYRRASKSHEIVSKKHAELENRITELNATRELNEAEAKEREKILKDYNRLTEKMSKEQAEKDTAFNAMKLQGISERGVTQEDLDNQTERLSTLEEAISRLEGRNPTLASEIRELIGEYERSVEYATTYTALAERLINPDFRMTEIKNWATKLFKGKRTLEDSQAKYFQELQEQYYESGIGSLAEAGAKAEAATQTPEAEEAEPEKMVVPTKKEVEEKIRAFAKKMQDGGRAETVEEEALQNKYPREIDLELQALNASGRSVETIRGEIVEKQEKLAKLQAEEGEAEVQTVTRKTEIQKEIDKIQSQIEALQAEDQDRTRKTGEVGRAGKRTFVQNGKTFYIVPTSSEGDRGYIAITEEEFKKWDEIDKEQEEADNLALRVYTREEDLNKRRKGIALEFARKKRNILGTTGENIRNTDKSKVQEGDSATVGGVRYEVVGFPFGRVSMMVGEKKETFERGDDTFMAVEKQILENKSERIAEEIENIRKAQGETESEVANKIESGEIEIPGFQAIEAEETVEGEDIAGIREEIKTLEESKDLLNTNEVEEAITELEEVIAELQETEKQIKEEKKAEIKNLQEQKEAKAEELEREGDQIAETQEVEESPEIAETQQEIEALEEELRNRRPSEKFVTAQIQALRNKIKELINSNQYTKQYVGEDVEEMLKNKPTKEDVDKFTESLDRMSNEAIEEMVKSRDSEEVTKLAEILDSEGFTAQEIEDFMTLNRNLGNWNVLDGVSENGTSIAELLSILEQYEGMVTPKEFKKALAQKDYNDIKTADKTEMKAYDSASGLQSPDTVKSKVNGENLEISHMEIGSLAETLEADSVVEVKKDGEEGPINENTFKDEGTTFKITKGDTELTVTVGEHARLIANFNELKAMSEGSRFMIVDYGSTSNFDIYERIGETEEFKPMEGDFTYGTRKINYKLLGELKPGERTFLAIDSNDPYNKKKIAEYKRKAKKADSAQEGDLRRDLMNNLHIYVTTENGEILGSLRAFRSKFNAKSEEVASLLRARENAVSYVIEGELDGNIDLEMSVPVNIILEGSPNYVVQEVEGGELIPTTMEFTDESLKKVKATGVWEDGELVINREGMKVVDTFVKHLEGSVPIIVFEHNGKNIAFPVSLLGTVENQTNLIEGILELDQKESDKIRLINNLLIEKGINPAENALDPTAPLDAANNQAMLARIMEQFEAIEDFPNVEVWKDQNFSLSLLKSQATISIDLTNRPLGTSKVILKLQELEITNRDKLRETIFKGKTEVEIVNDILKSFQELGDVAETEGMLEGTGAMVTGLVEQTEANDRTGTLEWTKGLGRYNLIKPVVMNTTIPRNASSTFKTAVETLRTDIEAYERDKSQYKKVNTVHNNSLKKQVEDTKLNDCK